MLSTKSLMTREESTAMKGLLMVLIMICHNALLNNSVVDGSFLPHRRYIYLFHVTCFFVLPLMYGYTYKYGEGARWRNIGDDAWRNFVRCWVPYTWFFLLFVGIGLVQHREFTPSLLAYAYIEGSQSPMAWILGVHFLWFLPSMCALLVMKSCWYNARTWVKMVLVVLGLTLMVQNIFEVFGYIDIWDTIPFSLVQGLKYLMIALVVRYMIECMNRKVVLTICTVLLIVLTAVFVMDEGKDEMEVLTHKRIEEWLMPMAVFPLLYHVRDVWAKSRLLMIIGRYSLYIYLTHIIVFNVVNNLLLHVCERSYWLGGVSLIITMGICIGIAWVIERSKWIKLIVFAK